MRLDVKAAGVEPPAAITALLDVIDASAAIDVATVGEHGVTFKDVIRRSDGALAAAQRLAEHERASLVGQALGTLGRAYLHAGDSERALPYLRQGVSHHEQHGAREVPRSMTYLATALRHAGCIADAAATARQAMSLLDGMAGRDIARTTRLYLTLELGRCELAAANAGAALPLFQRVVDDQQSDSAHPRISALRGLASVHRALGNEEQARSLVRRCVAVAKDSTQPRILRLLGVMPVGDALAANIACDETSVRLWHELTGARSDDEIRQLVARWVY
jgi:tetratricopeptide (TPR) repeat protein